MTVVIIVIAAIVVLVVLPLAVRSGREQKLEARRTEAQGRRAIAFFVGQIKDSPVDGVLRTLTDENDRVADVTLMVRPWAALKAGLADITI